MKTFKRNSVVLLNRTALFFSMRLILVESSNRTKKVSFNNIAIHFFQYTPHLSQFSSLTTDPIQLHAEWKQLIINVVLWDQFKEETPLDGTRIAYEYDETGNRKKVTRYELNITSIQYADYDEANQLKIFMELL